MSRLSEPRSVNDLIELNDSAACNILDMIDVGSLDKNDGAKIAELYAAHSAAEKRPKAYELKNEAIYYVGDKTPIATVNYSTMLRRGDAMQIVSRLNAHDDLVATLELIASMAGKTLLGDGRRYDEGANAAFEQCAAVAKNQLAKVLL
jgi:hypothetical protein